MGIPPAARVGRGDRRGADRDSSGDVVASSDFGIVRFSGCTFDNQPIGTFDWNQHRHDLRVQRRPRGADLGTRRRRRRASAVTTDVTPTDTTVLGRRLGWHDKAVRLHLRAIDNRGGLGVAYTRVLARRRRDLGERATASRCPPRPITAPTASTKSSIARPTRRATSKQSASAVLIDTRRPRPSPNGRRPPSRRSHRLALLRGDPRPGSPTATVTIRIHNAHGALVKKVVLPGGQGRHRRWTTTSPAGCPRAPTGSPSPPPTRPATRADGAAANTLVVR